MQELNLCDPGDEWSPDVLSSESPLAEKLRASAAANALVTRALDRLAALKIRQETEEQAKKDREAMAERAAEVRRKAPR